MRQQQRPTSVPHPQHSGTHLRDRRYVYPMALLALFAIIFLTLGIAPLYREDWLLENVLVFIALPVLVFGICRVRFTNLAYTSLVLFFVLHEVGAHYTYSLVPYDAWFEALTGRPLNELLGWQRNHYDRLIHFAYGLLIVPVVVELFGQVAAPRGVWRFILPVSPSSPRIRSSTSWWSGLQRGGLAATWARRTSARRAMNGTRSRIWPWPCSAQLSACSSWERFGRSGDHPHNYVRRHEAARASVVRAVSDHSSEENRHGRRLALYTQGHHGGSRDRRGRRRRRDA